MNKVTVSDQNTSPEYSPGDLLQDPNTGRVYILCSDTQGVRLSCLEDGGVWNSNCRKIEDAIWRSDGLTWLKLTGSVTIEIGAKL